MAWPIEQYLEERSHLSPRTTASYRWALRDAERRILASRDSSDSASDTTPLSSGRRRSSARSRSSTLEDLAERELADLAAAWRRNDQLLSHLRNFLRWAGHPLAESVPRGIRPEDRRRLIWYTYAEVEAAVDACRTPRERLVLHLALELMYRRIEIERALWSDFQETSILVHGKAQKGRGEKPRRIPWHPSTRTILFAFLARSTRRTSSPSGPSGTTPSVSGSGRGSPRTSSLSMGNSDSGSDRSSATLLRMKRSALDKELKRIGTRAGLGRPLQFHALRRTGGRLYVQAGIKAGKAPILVLIELQHIYGHEDLRTTLRYIGWEIEEAAETMALMPVLGERGREEGTAAGPAPWLETRRAGPPPRGP